ncbi:hypothetical protein Dimus_010813 [Dionaea muscipula]
MERAMTEELVPVGEEHRSDLRSAGEGAGFTGEGLVVGWELPGGSDLLKGDGLVAFVSMDGVSAMDGGLKLPVEIKHDFDGMPEHLPDDVDDRLGSSTASDVFSSSVGAVQMVATLLATSPVESALGGAQVTVDVGSQMPRLVGAEFGLPSTCSSVSQFASSRFAYHCYAVVGLVREEDVASPATGEEVGLQPTDGLWRPPRLLEGPLQVMVEGDLRGEGLLSMEEVRLEIEGLREVAVPTTTRAAVIVDTVQGVSGDLAAHVGVCRTPTAARVEVGDVGSRLCRVGDGSMSVGDAP